MRNKRRGNGPFGNPHPEAIEKVTCDVCQKREPTYMHRELGALCSRCWAKFKRPGGR